jgi:hypothetical protein
LIAKGENMMGAKYYKSEPLEYKFIPQQMPVFYPLSTSTGYLALGTMDTIDTTIPGRPDEYKFSKTYGYGMNTAGTLMISEGTSKGFGT